MIDRDLKERLIGAAVLVLVVVLVVPVFLDGPSGDGELVNERVPLPGQSDQETKTIVLERDRSSPVPSNAGNEPAATPPQTKQVVVEPEPQAKVAETTPEPVVAKPEPEQPAKQMPAAAPSTTGMWAVQLGSFSSQENAEKLAASLRTAGYAAFVSKLGTGSDALHRVRTSPLKDRNGAESLAAQLAKSGHTGQVVPHP